MTTRGVGVVSSLVAPLGQACGADASALGSKGGCAGSVPIRSSVSSLCLPEKFAQCLESASEPSLALC